MSELLLNLSNGTSMFVPDNLNSISTYVLLEQERWFEKELDFICRWVRPGMTVIDIGANLGVYCLPLARLVASNGRVFAYEPASRPRELLRKSAEFNRCQNLEVIGAALSDGEREGHLSIGQTTELGSLTGSGDSETVQVTSLDIEETRRGWAPPDFVKIDAEGEEERILYGGRGFFARYSPLVMFEYSTEALRSTLINMGYRIYRLLAGAPILVPMRSDEVPDKFNFNLFAVKPDRAQVLAQERFLVDQETNWAPCDDARKNALSFLQKQPFAASLRALFQESEALDPDYRNALAAYAHWRSPAVPSAERYAALTLACRILEDLCGRAPTYLRLSTLARANWDAGMREKSALTLLDMIMNARGVPISLTEPFWPACPRYEAIDPGNEAAGWLVAAVLEQWERSSNLSSLYAPPGRPHLTWLCSTPFAAAEMERRRVLSELRAGRQPAIPERLCAHAADNLNPDIWRNGFSWR